MNLIYLSIPYSFNPDLSFEIANKIAAKLLAAGKAVYSPISHNHCSTQYLPDNLQNDHDFWLDYDLKMLSLCSEMLIVKINKSGMRLIQESRGVQKEIDYAEQHNIPFDYYEWNTVDSIVTPFKEVLMELDSAFDVLIEINDIQDIEGITEEQLDKWAEFADYGQKQANKLYDLVKELGETLDERNFN